MLKQAKNVFFVGIKGVAMANLAVFLKKMGKNVFGADVNEEFITDRLLKNNKITWQVGFKKNLPKDCDLVVYSAAHEGLKNPLIVEANERKINIISQADLLGELMRDFQIKIAVAGCHGKTTTSSLLSYALNELKVKPSYVVGVPHFSSYQGGDYQANKYFVVEADEYGVNPPVNKTPKFLKLNPDWIICTNIDFDHPDVYKNIEETKQAFLKFFKGSYNSRAAVTKLLLCIDDINIAKLINQLDRKIYITYGFSDKADYQIVNWKVNENGSEFFLLCHPDTERAERVEVEGSVFKISLFGKHNIVNATAVIVQLLQLGFKVNEIKKAIIGFTGAERRSELVYRKNNTYLFDDYGHHPNEIKATIEAARARFKNKKVIVIFQPHTFSRTNFLLKEFRKCLSLADFSFILPIFASARENKSQFKIDSKDIVKGKSNLFYVQSDAQLVNRLNKVITKGDVIFTMGAGDVYKLKNKIIALINSKFEIRNSKQIINHKLQIQKNKDLSHFLTLRNRVKAEYFLEAKTKEDLVNAKRYSLENKLPLFILGGGSNLAIVKNTIAGLVVKNSYRELKILAEGRNDVIVSVSSGYPVSLLVAKSIKNGWGGFEYHQGLPGTVGGAIYMNSKWTKPVIYFGDGLFYAYLVDKNGKVKKVERNYFKFSYDYSILQKTKEIVLEAIFTLKRQNPKLVEKRAVWALEYRKKTQPFGVASSGCFFKNLGNVSAGYLIDKAGLKGFTLGDYFISPVHANFIINKGKGKRQDLLKLVKIIKEKVKEKFGVELKEEVIVV